MEEIIWFLNDQKLTIAYGSLKYVSIWFVYTLKFQPQILGLRFIVVPVVQWFINRVLIFLRCVIAHRLRGVSGCVGVEFVIAQVCICATLLHSRLKKLEPTVQTSVTVLTRAPSLCVPPWMYFLHLQFVSLLHRLPATHILIGSNSGFAFSVIRFPLPHFHQSGDRAETETGYLLYLVKTMWVRFKIFISIKD